MWSLLGSLINNFLLLRDLFGYAIPGAVLLGISGYFGFIDYSKFPLAGEAAWLKAIVAVTASYVIGHILAAIGYLPRDICKIVKRFCKASAQDDENIETTLYYRYLYPSMFIEADRRETLTILRIGLSVALIFAACLPALPTFLHIALAAIGVFLLGNAYLSLFEADQYKNHAVSAAIGAKAKGIPIFDWNGGNSSNKAAT
jgi:hypothetical protein